jgi:hypothetical protein
MNASIQTALRQLRLSGMLQSLDVRLQEAAGHMRRYETKSTMMTSNRPLEDWGKLLGDVPAATAILDRFLHHAEIITITGRSYRLRNQGGQADEPKDNGQASKEGKRSRKDTVEPPTGE